jgi:RNA polymerase sigma factor (sigma-70 family)
VASFVDTHGHAADEKDFEALYATYKSDVQRLASYLLKNASDAEDAAQTVFLNVLRALRQGVTPTDPRAWLLAITRNVCFSRGRAASARPAHVELDPEASQEPVGDGDETPSADEIVGALARLLPNQRTALILRDFRGVSRVEICDLMSLSPAAVEALLTRARAAFREELRAGDQPFECAETRALVEQQLDGLITVADRHSLRSHLRHCAPCSTLARAVRSSRGKLAGLLFGPAELISRLVDAFSQAPSSVHAAAGLTSVAALTTAVAIPVAVSSSPASHAHAYRPAAPAPARAAVASPASAAALSSSGATQQVSRVTPHAAPAGALAAARPAAHARPHVPAAHRPVRPDAAKSPGRAGKAAAARAAAAPVSHATTSTTTNASTTTTSTGRPIGTTTSTPSPTTTGTISAPAQDTVASVSTHSAAARATGFVTPASSTPRSSSPAARPTAKPEPKAVAGPKARPKPRAKPARKPSRRGSGRPVPAPQQTAPASSEPTAGFESADAPVAAPGAGVAVGPGATPAVVAPAEETIAGAAAKGGASGGTSSGSAFGSSAGDPGKKHHK